MSDIEAVAAAYIKAVPMGDHETLARLFADSARLYSTEDEHMTEMSRADYLAMVEDRDPVIGPNDTPPGGLLAVSTLSEDKAVITVECGVPPKVFRDFLVLIRDGAEWKIVSKVYHVVTAGP